MCLLPCVRPFKGRWNRSTLRLRSARFLQKDAGPDWCDPSFSILPGAKEEDVARWRGARLTSSGAHFHPPSSLCNCMLYSAIVALHCAVPFAASTRMRNNVWRAHRCVSATPRKRVPVCVGCTKPTVLCVHARACSYGCHCEKMRVLNYVSRHRPS